MSDWELDPDVLPFVSYPRALKPLVFEYVARNEAPVELDPQIQQSIDSMNERLARVEAMLNGTMEESTDE